MDKDFNDKLPPVATNPVEFADWLQSFHVHLRANANDYCLRPEDLPPNTSNNNDH